MDLFANLALGFSVAFTLQNLAYCFIGVLVGTLIGVLPGIGPLATISMLLPLTYTVSPVAALIMLAGIYYGAQYGGSTTAILVNLPGETSSVVTCLDGYQMARQGRAGPALAIAAIGSFIAGTIGTLLIAVAGPPLAEFALKFSAPEYFSLMLMGLVAAAALAQGDTIRSLAMVVVGLLLGLVGTDVSTGVLRFAFGVRELFDGVGFIVVAVGVFAIGEIVTNLGQASAQRVFDVKIANLWPSWADFRQSLAPILRGTALGSFFGVLPGTGPAIASFSSYMLEQKLAQDPSRFGKGAIEGVAGPEAANNADAQCKFIPMLTLGLPASAVMALMLGAMTIQGIQPGPEVMTQRPELFWGLIASMWVGNLMLVILNLPLIGMWVKLLKVPYRILVSGDRSLFRHWYLQRQQQLRRGVPRGVFWSSRLRLGETRLQSCSDASGLRVGSNARGKSAPRHAGRTRRSNHIFHPADQPLFHGRDGVDPGRHAHAGRAEEA